MATWEEYKKTMVAEDPIFEDARVGDCASLEGYLQKGGDVNVCNHRGYSLLMLAAYNGECEAVSLLLRYGANVNSADRGGNTVLMGVAFKGLTDVVELLLTAGADARLENAHGMTALDFAKIFGRKDVMTLLSQSESTWRDPLEVAAKVMKKKMGLFVSP